MQMQNAQFRNNAALLPTKRSISSAHSAKGLKYGLIFPKSQHAAIDTVITVKNINIFDVL